MRPDAAVVPDIAEIHRCVPDLRAVLWQQTAGVVADGRAQERVVNDNIARAAEQAQLDVAHTPGEEIYVLRHEQHRGLIVDMLSPALIGECEQQRTGSAGGVYKNAVFDTNRKSRLRHISAEKGLKQRAFEVPLCFILLSI